MNGSKGLGPFYFAIVLVAVLWIGFEILLRTA